MIFVLLSLGFMSLALMTSVHKPSTKLLFKSFLWADTCCSLNWRAPRLAMSSVSLNNASRISEFLVAVFSWYWTANMQSVLMSSCVICSDTARVITWSIAVNSAMLLVESGPREQDETSFSPRPQKRRNAQPPTLLSFFADRHVPASPIGPRHRIGVDHWDLLRYGQVCCRRSRSRSR